MEENPNIHQLVNKIKRVFNGDLVFINYYINFPGPASFSADLCYNPSDPNNLHQWSISFIAKCGFTTYLLTIDPSCRTNEQTEYLINSVFGDFNHNDFEDFNGDDQGYSDYLYPGCVTMSANDVLNLLSEGESILYEKITSTLFSLY